MVLAAFALFGVTWKLWTPQTIFPQIPFIESVRYFPRWLDWLCFALVIGSLFSILVFSILSGRVLKKSIVLNRWLTASRLIFLLATTMLILLDQHRFQTWAYQFLLIVVVMSATSPSKAVMWLRILTVGIYAHSAFSKFDASFLNTHGQQLARATLEAVGLSFDIWNESARQALAFSLPLGEFVIAICLCVPYLRRLGIGFAIFMHFCLLIALGPFGLNHKPGVLIWNIFFATQTVLLFGSLGKNVSRGSNSAEVPETTQTPEKIAHKRGNQLAGITVLGAICLPLLEPFGMFDHWPGWALYASKSERVTLFVHVSQREKLPETVRKFTAKPSSNPWCKVDIDKWSLNEFNAPVYPQDRFRLGVARALIDRSKLKPGTFRILMESSANRLAGQRSMREITNQIELDSSLSKFQLNTKSRP